MSGVGEDFIRTILEMEQTLFHIAGISFIINKVYSSQKQLDIAGITSMEYLLEGVIQLPVMRSLTLQFLSPTLFRIGNSEYAAADSRLIFGSLAERWNAFSDGFKIDTDEIKQLALELTPAPVAIATRRPLQRHPTIISPRSQSPPVHLRVTPPIPALVAIVIPGIMFPQLVISGEHG